MNSGLESWTYNSRLQATGVKGAAGFSLDLDYGGSANNGNLLSQAIGRGVSGWSQGFAYDGVNRLCAAAEGTGAVAMSGCAAPVSGVNWSQSYGYDRYGNRWVSASTGYGLGTYTAAAASNFDGGNHLAIAGVAHDSAGNQTQMGAGLAMSYDADGRMAGSTLNGTATSYVYDADGRRVLKQTGSVATVYVYDAFGQLALETGGIPETACTTCFVTVDQLGSTRQTVSRLGVATGCHDYLPFGEELNGVGGRSGGCWGTADTTLKFTGKQRDSETVSSGMATGLDYFGARYFSSAQGRFSSPDPISGTVLHLLNPQRWNMYAYAVNNPLAYVDPDGRDAIAVKFGNGAHGLGHAGIASVHHDRKGTFADFSPQHADNAHDAGKYTFDDFKTKLSYGADGKPTKASLTALANELADNEQQPRDSVSVAYFKTSDAETAALDAYINAARAQQAQGTQPTYWVGFRDCIWFCMNGMAKVGQGLGSSPLTIPNFQYTAFWAWADQTATGTKAPKEQVTSKLCYTDENGKQVCQ